MLAVANSYLQRFVHRVSKVFRHNMRNGAGFGKESKNGKCAELFPQGDLLKLRQQRPDWNKQIVNGKSSC